MTDPHHARHQGAYECAPWYVCKVFEHTVLISGFSAPCSDPGREPGGHEGVRVGKGWTLNPRPPHKGV